MKKLLPVLFFFLLFTLSFSGSAHAQCITNTFNFRVTDQNGNPLQGAFVPVYWKGRLYTYCSTGSSGQCYVCLSCAQPCELSGDVEYQSYTGSYSGSYYDGALIEVIINIPAPSPTPSPPPYPTPTPTPPVPPTPLTCSPSNPGAKDSRPVPCDACNQTDLLTPSCATTFTVNDKVSYRRGDGAAEPPHCVETPWGGTVTIDPSDTTIPFVGKKGQEDEQKYLADYFDGTGFYYAPPYDFTKLEDVLRAFREGGVWRKLAPQTVQDKYKKQVVDRAVSSLAGTIQEGVIHDYLVSYKGESARLSEFAGHLPPDPDEENYLEKYEAWKKSDGGKWYRLWAAVPMFSREDTPGEINPYLGSRPRDSFEIQNPTAQVEKVPHLARLYEVTKALHQFLLSWTGSESEAQVLGEKTLLAQGPPDFPYGCKWYYSTNPNDPTDCSCMETGTCRGEHGGCCPPHGYWGICGWDDCQPETRCPNPPSKGCPGAWIIGDPSGPSIPPPICGLRGPLPVASCDLPAITDSNPNDNLCCSPINISLSAVDIFENPEYDKCRQEGISCEPIPNCTPTPTNDCLRCKDPCDKMVEKDVNRRAGIMLLHPYLTEIWDYTTNIFSELHEIGGFFNIFRPGAVPEFEDTAAASQVRYSYSPGTAEPSVGDFYFPYLGGVQKAKEWVVRAIYPR